MGLLRSKIAHAIIRRLSFLALTQSKKHETLEEWKKQSAKHLKQLRALVSAQDKRAGKYFKDLKTLASVQDKRLKTLERRLESSARNIKQVTKLHQASSRALEATDQKINLLILARQHDQVNEAVKRLKTVHPTSEIASHINRSISNAVLLTDPCPHAVIDDVLPSNIYTAICSDMPPLEFWRQGQPGRYNWTIGEDTAPLAHEAAWSFMNNVIAQTIVVPALVNKFDQHCAPPAQKIGANKSGASGVEYNMSDGRLMLRGPGYSLEPHVDPRRSILTVLMYMGTSNGSEDYGTKLFTSDCAIPLKYSGIYYPLREGVSCKLAKSIPCRPNSMLVFSSRLGIHGADIPSDTQPPTLTRHTYHFFIGINKHKGRATR